MDLNALELFVAAAEAGSLSAAARRTRVPLPTLSRRVRKLEDDLGVRLLERGPHGLALTPAGTQLLAEATPALATLSQAEQRLYDSSGVAGTLRVSIPPHFEPMQFVFSEFCRRYPAVRLDVFVTDRRVDLVADGIDVVVRVGEGGYSSYVGRTLARYRHRVVGAPSLLPWPLRSSSLGSTAKPSSGRPETRAPQTGSDPAVGSAAGRSQGGTGENRSTRKSSIARTRGGTRSLLG